MEFNEKRPLYKLKEIASIAFLDIKEFYDEKGEVLKVHLMPERARRAIAGLDIDGLG